ncbi:MAG: hypothetical protein ACXWCW_31770, partial [Burkholderiales bacterium]
ERGVLDEEECFIDATFVMAKGGGAEVGAGLFFLDIADVSKMSTPMLAEIFLLRVETATREAARDKARFVPIMLPAAAAKPASVPSVRSA